jgi:hemolysin activation/secretion protein
MFLKSLISLSVLLVTVPLPVRAQPTAPLDRSPSLPEIPDSFEPLPPPDELLEAPRPPSTVPVEPGTAPTTIVVNQFQVLGSTVFSDADFLEVLTPFIGRPLSLSELLNANQAVTDLYIENGYITTGSFVPAGQVVDDGVVVIQVVEGQLADISVQGSQRLNPDYLRSRINLIGQPLNVNRLLRALQNLQVDPLIDNLSAELVETPNPGESELRVTVQEADSFSLQFQLNNYENPLVESFQQQVQLTELNLTGQGDNLTLTYQHAGLSNTVQLDYALPISPRNTTLEASYSYVDSQVVEPPLGLINPQTESNTWSLGIQHPLIQTPENQLTLGLNLSQRSSQTFLEPPGLPRIPFGFPGSGANQEGFIQLTTLSFTQAWQQQSPESLLLLNSEFRLGLDFLGATGGDNASEPSTEYLNWRGQFLWLQRLEPNWLLVARSAIQVSDRPLVSAEQFSLGGANNIRGYRTDQILADSGWLFSVELQKPILNWPEQNSTVTLATFLDYGLAWNQDNQAFNASGRELAATGLGLIWDIDNRFNVRVDWGIPLINVPTIGDTLQESGITFSITGTL